MTRALLTLLATLTLLSCSATKFAYNRAEWYLGRKARAATCPTDAQEKLLGREIKQLISWHRKQELPRYAQLLRSVASAAEKPISRPTFDKLYADINQAWDRAANQLSLPFARYAGSFGAKQNKCLLKHLEEMRQETRDRLRKSESDYREYQVDKRVEMLERWVGDLTKAQKQTLAQGAATKSTGWQIYTARGLALERLKKMLEGRDQKAKQAMLARIIRVRYAIHNQFGQALFRRLGKKMKQRIWAVVASLSPKQRKTLRKRMRGYAADFETLSKQ